MKMALKWRYVTVLLSVLVLCACGGGSSAPPAPTYTIGGIVSGLTGSGLVITNNGGDALPVLANGPFTFSSSLATGEEYSVAVVNSPTSPGQTCIVTAGSGTVASANITNITVACTTDQGEVCSSAGECGTGFCADGVCCNTSCAGSCEACSSALTGEADGICAAAMPSGSASYLDFTTQPVDVVAGANFDVAVSARDADSCIVTDFTDTIAVAIQNNPADGTLAGTTAVAALAGTATFSGLSIDKSGSSYVLRATSAGLDSADSTSFNVIPGNAVKLDFVQEPQSADAGSTLQQVAIQVSDANGNLVSSAINVTLAITGGGATLSGTTTKMSSNGVATFDDLSITKAGTYTLTVSGAGLTEGTSANFTIAPAATSQIALTPDTGSYTSGTANSFVVTALDAYGNITPLYRGTVYFSSSDSAAILPADTAFSDADNGSHSFSISFRSAGDQTLTVTDTIDASLTASHSYTVMPAAIAYLQVTGPTYVTIGSSFTITVSAQDAYANTVTSYIGTVQFTSTDPVASLPWNYTFTADDNGSHSFTGLSLTSPGDQLVIATDTVTSLSGSVSVAVGVLPP